MSEKIWKKYLPIPDFFVSLQRNSKTKHNGKEKRTNPFITCQICEETLQKVRDRIYRVWTKFLHQEDRKLSKDFKPHRHNIRWCDVPDCPSRDWAGRNHPLAHKDDRWD